jgi:hypothetical protein
MLYYNHPYHALYYTTVCYTESEGGRHIQRLTGTTEVNAITSQDTAKLSHCHENLNNP